MGVGVVAAEDIWYYYSRVAYLCIWVQKPYALGVGTMGLGDGRRRGIWKIGCLTSFPT